MLGKAALIREIQRTSPLTETRIVVPEKKKSESVEVDPDARRSGGLVLSRHLGQSIMIDDQIDVKVATIKSGTVRLKVVAPRTIAIHRLEVFEAIQAGTVPPPTSERLRDEPSQSRPGKPGGGLVLARFIGQSIMIGDEIQVTVVEVRPSTVKLRISAPKSVPVHRREVYD